MLHLLLAYAYPLMVPLSLVEGPLVAMAGGVGAAVGRIDPWIVFAIVMGGGLFQDVLYYHLGRWAGRSARVRGFVGRFCAVERVMAPLEAAWRRRMFLTLLASKFAYGLYAPILVSAGMVRAPFWRFLGQSMLLSAVVLAGWEAAGFGLMRAYGGLGPAAHWVTLALGVLGVAAVVLIARWARRQIQLQPDGRR